MNPHAIIAYARYRMKAKRLHGVHSPFAYAFSEEVLYADKYDQPAANAARDKYQLLQNRIKNYYQLTGPTELAYDTMAPVTDTLLVINDSNPGHWLQILNKHLPYIQPGITIIIPGIHADKRKSMKWQLITKHPKIPMCIDVFGCGLLFFRKEFKEKQHFILKY